MITLQELEQRLSAFYPSAPWSDFGPNGLQVEGTPQIERVATAVSASLVTLQAAVDAGVQVLIVHHGLFWKGDSYCVIRAKREKLRLLLENGISLFDYHLPMDCHETIGNNWTAAREMGWKDLEIFGSLPLGVRGSFVPLEVSSFQKQLETYYGHTAQVALGGKKTVSSAALISGGAYKEIGQAAAANVDCFITGNFDEPAWNMAHEEGINFFALGHSATERVGPRALAHYLEKEWKLPATFLDIPNPF